MLHSIELRHVGPVADLSVELGSRLNFVTGDNGLGKSFLLDAAWFGMTRTWAGWPARPEPEEDASMSYSFSSNSKATDLKCTFKPEKKDWVFPKGAPSRAGILIYAQVDGSFAVWDPDRNAVNDSGKPPAFNFTPSDLWYGLSREVPQGKDKIRILLCNGLLQDLILWQARSPHDGQFELFGRILEQLSPLDEPIRMGTPMRINGTDPREYPTIINTIGQCIPIVHASAGVRRILTLAYLLLWAWKEHQLVRKDKPARKILFLIDEIEGHLHPRWQRTIVRSILEATRQLAVDGVEVQLLAVTHSPLVLASLEPFFDPETDRIWALERRQEKIVLEHQSWSLRGNIGNWLAFMGIQKPYSVEAEIALNKATALVVAAKANLEDAEKVNGELGNALGESDPFWVRWRVWLERLRGEA